MNLKKILMELGNHLVMDCGFDPPVLPIVNFTNWLNDDDNARGFLAGYGCYWPVVGESAETPDEQAAKDNFKVLIYAVMRSTPTDDRMPIWAFERFLNDEPEARFWLMEQGVNWPMTPVMGLVRQADKLRGK